MPAPFPFAIVRPLLLVVCCILSCSAFAAEKTVLILGDSLSAGFGLARHESWPALLEARLQQRKPAIRVSNISISGETTAGGRARLDAALKQFNPAVVVIALGANDGLRGLPVAQLRDNLSAMTKSARASGAKVLIAGMRLPPNYGAAYGREFEAAFAAVARAEKSALLPFLLEPIAAERDAFQADGLHPVAGVQARLLEHVLPRLLPLLD